jgi:hypothetical protein
MIAASSISSQLSNQRRDTVSLALPAELQQRLTSGRLQLSPSALSASVEPLLPQLLRKALRNELGALACHRSLNFRAATLPDRFVLDGRPYVVEVASHGMTLAVQFRLIGAQYAKQRKCLRQELEYGGRMQFVSLSVDEHLGWAEADLAAFAHQYLSTGYLWTRTTSERRLSQAQDDFTAQLYDVVRRKLPEELANHVWLVGFADQKGMYLTDQKMRQRAIDKFNKSPVGVRESTTELLGHFNWHKYDLRKTFTQQAIRAARPIIGELSVVPYELGSHAFAESAIYDIGQWVIDPVANAGDVRVTAGYPPSLADRIAPALAECAQSLGDILIAAKKPFMATIADVAATTGADPRPWYARALDLQKFFFAKPEFMGVGVDLDGYFRELFAHHAHENPEEDDSDNNE